MVLEREIALKMVGLFLLGEGKKGESYLLWVKVEKLYYKSKFQKSYKDIEDEKFQEVIDYIEFLKKNPS